MAVYLEHILAFANKRGKHHVDTLVHAKLDVLLILLGQGREINLAGV